MKRKEITVTVLACAALIAAGTFAFSLLYKAMFRPDAVIGDYSEDPTWLEEQARYEKAVLYPLSSALESGVIEKTDGSDMLADLYHINEAVYSSVLKLAGTAWEEIKSAVVTEYEYKPGTTEHDRYGLRQLFHIVSADNNMLIAVDKSYMPVLLMYGAGAEPEPENSASESSPTSEDFPEGLSNYLAQTDAALDENSSYRRLIIAIQDGINSEGELPPGSLVEYSKLGEWKIYSGPQSAAYVCIVNDYNFILYYDLVNESFCGYSIALNDLG